MGGILKLTNMEGHSSDSFVEMKSLTKITGAATVSSRVLTLPSRLPAS